MHLSPPFNLKLLVKNINANQCEGIVHIITNPLTATTGFADFRLSNTTEGGALSSFGVGYGHDGKPLHKAVSFQTLGFPLDALVEQKIIPKVPALIKIDVDGIENLVLRGAAKTIRHIDCRTILIEVNDAFVSMAAEVEKILTESGFVMILKKAPDNVVEGDNFTFNQIWVKA